MRGVYIPDGPSSIPIVLATRADNADRMLTTTDNPTCAALAGRRPKARPSRRSVGPVLRWCALVLLAACSGGDIAIDTRIDPEYRPKDWDSVEIRLERAGCEGACPVYDLVIRGDGTVSFTGEKYVDVQGAASDKLARFAVERLLGRFSALRFFELKDRYTMDGVDLPLTTVTLSIDGRTKTVMSVWMPPHGFLQKLFTDTRVHERLDTLATTIDIAARSNRWIGTGGRR